MRAIDADKVLEEHPDRRSLGEVIRKQDTLTVFDIIEEVKTEMCRDYCKKPYEYSAGKWEQMMCDDDPEWPCFNCPLGRI